MIVDNPLPFRLLGTAVVLMLTALSHADEKSGGSSKLDWDRDVRAVWQTARRTDRPMLVFVTMDSCLYCQKMKKTTLDDRDVIRDLRMHFEPVVLHVKDAPDLVQLLGIKSLPTTVIVLTNGDVVELLSGYQTARQLRQRLHATLRLVARERRDTARR